MKKNAIVILFFIGFLFALPLQATAAIYEFAPENQNDFSLDHGKYYLWGIDWSVPEGEEIVSATLSITDLNNFDAEDNIIYIHLLNSVDEGLESFNDTTTGDDLVSYEERKKLQAILDALGLPMGAAGNNLPPDSEDVNVFLGSYIDYDGGPQGNVEDYVYNFTEENILSLENFTEDGNFGFGFDSDCHFDNSGVFFKVITRKNAVPEPASLALFGIGLAGAFVRRRFI